MEFLNTSQTFGTIMETIGIEAWERLLAAPVGIEPGLLIRLHGLWAQAYSHQHVADYAA